MPSSTLKIVNKQEILISQCFFPFFLLGHHGCCYCLVQSRLQWGSTKLPVRLKRFDHEFILAAQVAETVDCFAGLMGYINENCYGKTNDFTWQSSALHGVLDK